MFTVPRAISLATAAMVACASIAACGGDDDPATAAPKDNTSPDAPPEIAQAMEVSAVWPLTGETIDAELPDHPVYVAKIDNTSSSAPQEGLGSADMVVEEEVEGGLTRLAAFYYSDLPELVGPVRSMRATDVGIVKPMEAVIIAAGGARPTKKLMAAADIEDLGEGSPGFSRASGRSAPYNLFADLSTVSADPTKGWSPPPKPYFEFGDGADLTDAREVTSITAEFSGAHTTQWTHTDDGWSRPDSNAASGDDYVADTVLLLRVRQKDAGYVDPAGNPVPETILYGKGAAVLVAGNRALPCTWYKADRASQLQLRTAGGEHVEVPVGRVFIELVPTSGKVTLSE